MFICYAEMTWKLIVLSQVHAQFSSLKNFAEHYVVKYEVEEMDGDVQDMSNDFVSKLHEKCEINEWNEFKDVWEHRTWNNLAKFFSNYFCTLLRIKVKVYVTWHSLCNGFIRTMQLQKWIPWGSRVSLETWLLMQGMK